MKLWEHVAADDMPALHNYVTDKILPMLEKEGRISIARVNAPSDQRDVSVQILRAIWRYMWDNSTHTGMLPEIYQGLYTGSMADAVRSVVGSAVNDKEVRAISSQALLILSHPDNQITQIVKGRRSGSEYGVRKFDSRFPISLVRGSDKTHIRYDWRDEQRERAETSKPENAKVVSTWALPDIPPPPETGNPEDWGDWGKTVFGIVATQQRRMVALQKTVEQLREELEAVKSNGWKGVAEGLAAEWQKLQETTQGSGSVQ